MAGEKCGHNPTYSFPALLKEGLCLLFFSLLLLLGLPLSVSSGLNFALQLFPLNLPPLTYQLPTLSSKQLFIPYNVLLLSFPSDASQWLAKPGYTSVCWGVWDTLGWDWGRLCLVCFREQSKGSTWEEVARAGLVEFGNLQLFGEDEGGVQTQQGALWE